MSFGVAVVDFYRRYARFDGRSSRSAFWWIVLYFALLGVAVQYLFRFLGADTGGLTLGLPTAAQFPDEAPADAVNRAYQTTAGLLGLAHMLPQLAVLARRLHDAAYSRVWMLIGLVPVAGAIVLLVFTLQPSAPRLPEERPAVAPSRP